MALTEQSVSGVDLPGLTEEVVDLAQGDLVGGLDGSGNLWLADNSSIFLGNAKDIALTTNANQTSFKVEDYLLQKTLLELNQDGTTTLHTANSNEMGSWLGNLAIAENGAYIRY